jgi:HAD superfamily hydrolase (TIGR01509 family)
MNRFTHFLFDLNGTMIDDMQYHIGAWHRILNELGATISMEKTKMECYGKNQELLERIFPGRFTLAEKVALSIAKEKEYQEKYKPNLKPVNGLEDFLKLAVAAGIPMAIGSAAIMYNIDFVLDHLGLRKYFNAVISADDVINSKPDPETFFKCATALNALPENCLVFEDAAKGVESAAKAGMQTAVITIMHTAGEFSGFHNIIDLQNDFTKWCENSNTNKLRNCFFQ